MTLRDALQQPEYGGMYREWITIGRAAKLLGCSTHKIKSAISRELVVCKVDEDGLLEYPYRVDLASVRKLPSLMSQFDLLSARLAPLFHRARDYKLAKAETAQKKRAFDFLLQLRRMDPRLFAGLCSHCRVEYEKNG